MLKQIKNGGNKMANYVEVQSYGGKKIKAYKEKYLDENWQHFAFAEILWKEEWQKQGAVDEGTCCLGKGLEVCYIPKGCRKHRWKNVVNGEFSQGNVGVAKARYPAMEYLKKQGFEVAYNDGWMD